MKLKASKVIFISSAMFCVLLFAQFFQWRHTRVAGKFRLMPPARIFKSNQSSVPNVHTLEQVEAGDYSFVRNAFTSLFKPGRNDVTITTHMDVSRLRYAMNLASTWSGPLEITVFLSSVDMWSQTMHLIENIRSCDDASRQFISWHLMFPGNHTIPLFFKKMGETNSSGREGCKEEIEEDIREIGDLALKLALWGSNMEHFAYYPHTKLMNVAVTSCATEFFLAIDSDLTPSEGIRQRFLSFAEKHNLFGPTKPLPKNLVVGPGAKVYSVSLYKFFLDSIKQKSDGPVCPVHIDNELPPPDLYVIPSFEFDGTRVPRTMGSIREEFENGKARSFYHFYNPGYGPTNHAEWVKQSDGKDGTECLYEVQYFFSYEPFFIVRMGIPIFDERYSGYQPVDSAHVATLVALGYKFKVLENVFLVHDGWKESNQMQGQKKKEASEANPSFEELTQQLEKIYAPG